jgi:hypothetical protein
MHLGLIPHWAADPSIGNRMINARAETLTELPSFKSPIRNQTHQRSLTAMKGRKLTASNYARTELMSGLDAPLSRSYGDLDYALGASS